MFRLKSTIQFLVTVIATISLFIICWATWQVINQPDLGILWSDQGGVVYAPQGSAFQVGDTIQKIDGVALSESMFPYFLWQYGDLIEVEVERDGFVFNVEVHYVDKAPLSVLLPRISLILVVFAFWGIGTSLVLFSSYDYGQSLVFFLFCQTLGVSLIIGSITSYTWAAHVSLILTCLAVALAVHFHLLFPINRITSSNRKWVWSIYIVAILGSSRIFIMLGIFGLRSSFSVLYSLLVNLWVLFGLVSVLVLLFKSYRDTQSALIKRQVGLVVICGALAFMPLLILSILPQIFFNEYILSPELGFIFFIFVPIGYGYAITRYQFIKLERYASRSATAVFVICLLAFFYFGISIFLQFILHDEWLANPWFTVIIIMGLVILYQPLHKYLRRLIDSLLYGGWYDYPSVVGQITHNLEGDNDIDALVTTLSKTIQKSMRVYWASLFWHDNINPDHSVVSTAGQPEKIIGHIQPDKLPEITAYMQTQLYPMTSRDLREAIGSSLSKTERELLDYPAVRLWVPIQGRGESLGLLILGPKFGGDVFDQNDMEILDMVSRHASVTFQNVQLINELKAKAHESEQYKKEIIRTREEERKAISRELHDQVIQVLVGLKYQIAHLQFSLKRVEMYPEIVEETATLQNEVGDLIQTTRSLCQGLRPAALDLGLIPSIRSLVGSYEVKSDIDVELSLEGDRDIPIDEDIALCLYRCTGEALSNIRKHAAAQEIAIRLCINPTIVSLAVFDNGRGFQVPERLGSFMTQNHFGLVGMRERVELLQGDFSIDSNPTYGTQLEVSIPLKNNHLEEI